MKGVVHLETVVTLPGGTFEGIMFWIGDLELAGETDPYPNTLDLVEVKWHTFWKGTGAYDGWKITQNFNTHPPWTSGMDMPGNMHLTKPIDE